MFMQPNGFDAKEAYRDGSSRKKRREALAKSLASEVVEAQPARLLVLLNQGAKMAETQRYIFGRRNV